MVQFCYLRLYFRIDIVSQQTRYRTYSNQMTTRLIHIMQVTKKQFMVGHA